MVHCKKTGYFSSIMDTQATENKEKIQVKKKPRGRKIKRREKPKKVPITYSRNPTKIGYMRVSTEKQDHALQYDSLVAAGVLPEHIFKDTISGSKVSREGRDACLKYMIPGDTLYVWKLDRFSRSLKDILNKLDEILAMGINFVSITQNLDTSTPTGRAMVHMIGLFSEFERETIRERVIAGIKAKRDSGEIERWGRKPTVEYDEKEVLNLLLKKSIREVSKITGVPKSTILNIKKRNERSK